MTKLSDAPWIVEAETKGIYSPEPPVCPVCGRECDTVYIQHGEFSSDYGLILGCNRCITAKDAWDWQEDNKEE